MADRVGQQLGNYRLTRLLGRGGFAEVYLGEHLRLNTQAAIKVLHTSLEDDDVEGFLREAQIVARLKHPHIVRVFDFDVENHTPFLVMDYLPNGNVRRSHPKGTPLPLSTIVSYVRQVTSALQYAHDEKLIHRDIKPENMLLDRDNTLVLSDFGIALMAQSSRYQSTQEVAGTAAYMAPEQFQGHPRRASDQYALGIVVYEWLSGDRPFHGSFSEIASQHLFVAPPSLHGKMPTILPDVERVVLTALEKDPDKRFGSVKAFANALEQMSQARQSHSSVLSWAPTVPSQPLQAQKLASPLMPAPPPIGSTIPADTSAQSPTMAPLPSKIVPTPVIATPPSQPQQTFDTSGTLDRPEPAHQGISRRTVVLGLSAAGLAVASGGLTWLALSHLSPRPVAPTPTTALKSTPTPSGPPLGSTLYTYRGHSKVVEAVAWSPDGKFIASASDDRTVQVWDAATGSTILTYRGHSTNVGTVVWSPNSKRIASAGFADKTVHVWNATNGENVLIYSGSSPAVWTLSWSPHDTRIASGGGQYDSISNKIIDTTVQVWDAVTGSTILTYRGHSPSAGASGVVDSIAWSPDGKRIASASINVQIWEAATGSTLLTFRGGHSDPYFVNAVAWSPDGRFIASCVNDPNDPAFRTVQVWDASTGNILYTYRGHFAQAQVGVLPANMMFFASWESSTAGYTRVYESSLLSGGGRGVTAAVWSPDGTRLASCADSPDKTVQIWDATTGEHALIYRGHSNGVLTIAWSPDGKRIASGSSDRTVQVWQAG